MVTSWMRGLSKGQEGGTVGDITNWNKEAGRAGVAKGTKEAHIAGVGPETGRRSGLVWRGGRRAQRVF